MDNLARDLIEDPVFGKAFKRIGYVNAKQRDEQRDTESAKRMLKRGDKINAIAYALDMPLARVRALKKEIASEQ